MHLAFSLFLILASFNYYFVQTYIDDLFFASNFLRSRYTLSNRMPVWNGWQIKSEMFDVSIPQSANHYRFALILRESAPRHQSNVFFNSLVQKNLGKRYPTQWRDWNRSGSNSLAWNSSRINNYNGAFLSKRNYDSILRRRYGRNFNCRVYT